jgi:hypothetical protein
MSLQRLEDEFFNALKFIHKLWTNRAVKFLKNLLEYFGQSWDKYAPFKTVKSGKPSGQPWTRNKSIVKAYRKKWEDCMESSLFSDISCSWIWKYCCLWFIVKESTLKIFMIIQRIFGIILQTLLDHPVPSMKLRKIMWNKLMIKLKQNYKKIILYLYRRTLTVKYLDRFY